MVPNAAGALEPATSADDLVKYAPGLRKLGAELDVIDLLNKDSSNLTPKDWMLLINKIYELQSKYDGIIVTHGTDTMAYTATATSLAFGPKLTLPIIFTGSQLPIIDPGTDADVNLERSMQAMIEAINRNICEVMIVFADSVLRASRTIKVSEARFDAFDSPAFPHLADITATDIVFSPLAKKGKKGPKLTAKPQNTFANGIVSIDVRPGLEPKLVAAITKSDESSSLILKSLGAGNVPSEKEYSLLPVIKDIVRAGKPEIIATKFIGGRTIPGLYEPGRAAIEAGAGHAGNMTDVAAEVKLMWLMGQGIRDPKKVNQAMLKSFVGEID